MTASTDIAPQPAPPPAGRPPCTAPGYAAAAAWIREHGSEALRQALADHERLVEPRRPDGGDGTLAPCVVARLRRDLVSRAMEEGMDGERNQTQTATPAAVPPTWDLVVPLGTGSAQGDIELRYLMRSALANLRGLRLIHIIGPRQPAWLVTHEGVRFHRWRPDRVKDWDIIRKFLYAATLADVSDVFVGACDDWCFLQPVTPVADWGALQVGQLSNALREGFWKRSQAATRICLEQVSKSVLFYDTHTPSVMTKAGWLQVGREVRWETQRQHAVWSLYHNVAGPGGPVLGAEVLCGWHAGDGSARPRDRAEIERATAGKLFCRYNDAGLTRDTLAWLADRFPRPAPWEGAPAVAAPAPRPDRPDRPATPRQQPVVKPTTPPRAAPQGLGVVAGPVGPLEASVTVTCHPPYLGSLRQCLESIDRQTLAPVSRLLCLDGVAEVPAWLATDFPAWRIERGAWHSPNPGRNLGWQTQPAPWVWYMDADNAAHPEYLAGAAQRAADHVGIVHADLAYTNGRRLATPDGLDYWGMRLHNYVDTAAVWRRDAIRECGGWRPTERWDDWDLALRVTAAGWHTARNRVPILFTVHPKGEEHRNGHGVDLAHKWGRSYAIVSLLAGRKGCWPKWRDAYLAQELPERCTLYLVDDSRSAEFGRELAELRAALEAKGRTVVILRPHILPEEHSQHWDRHRRVCRLYNAIVPRIAEDVTVTWEDDNVPRTPDALRQLCAHWEHTRCGGICAMYETRNHAGLVCGSPGKDHWGPLRSLGQCRGRRNDDWGFLPGGFAIWHTPLMLAAMPFCVSFPDGKGDSWDGKLSRTVRAAGFRLDLDGSVEVDHLFREG